MSKKKNCITFRNNPCNSKIRIQESSKKLRNKLQHAKECCDEEEFEEITSYFPQKSPSNKTTNEDLLIALQKYYIEKKNNDINFNLPLNKFIEMFPRDTSLKGHNFKRQHIFEQICRLLLLFNKDNGEFGNIKEFYQKLETFSKGNKKSLTKNQILKENINEGSKAGSVDIFFKIKKKSKN